MLNQSLLSEFPQEPKISDIYTDIELIDYYTDLVSDYFESQLFPELQITVMEYNKQKSIVAGNVELILQDTLMSAQVEKSISFSKFKKLTHHRHVKFVWTNPVKTKEFESEKFYCNYMGKELLSLPCFTMSTKQTWTQIDENKFKAVSEYGSTVFEVLN